eukprot:TRINITY_DN4466_c0_g1_i2.p2 TRINITY_DN4466_c0_g1~~TRINITY_DN4466_c0_g1_i2.p2  ORF type:complete len:128 (+),score=34.28 TRINITY_DN4466_c0_g1_i2:174-557(+)
MSVLDIEVAENGSNLSQGEKQLVCIARVLAKRPKILLLDEATATLDEATEDKVLRSIWELLKDSTILMISHKESTLDRFTRILHVANHSIEEECLFALVVNNCTVHTVITYKAVSYTHLTLPTICSV